MSIGDELLRRMHDFMRNYMKSFYTDDDEVQLGIDVKEKHTGYVTANSVELAKQLKLSRHDVALAEIIGLFHDIGRFRQYAVYKTFNDARSEDHAQMGVKYLAELPFMQELVKDDYDTVIFAIKNHNKREIEPTDDKRKKMFAEIIRDADKLDIYRVLEPYLVGGKKGLNFVGANAKEEVSPDFIDDFVAGKQADYYRIRTEGDRKLVRLMWVYDINFAWTMRKIVERGYIDKIAAALLPMNDKMKTGIEKLQDYVKDKCEQNDEQNV